MRMIPEISLASRVIDSPVTFKLNILRAAALPALHGEISIGSPSLSSPPRPDSSADLQPRLRDALSEPCGSNQGRDEYDLDQGSNRQAGHPPSGDCQILARRVNVRGEQTYQEERQAN